MHPDLPKLLEVQARDRRLAELDARADEIAAEVAVLDQAIARERTEMAQAERALGDTTQRRDEAEQKLEAHRAQHERRRQRLDQERNPRVAAQLLADVELGRSILAQEESDWLRLSEEFATREAALAGAGTRLAAVVEGQAAERATLDGKSAVLATEREGAQHDRDMAASHLDRPLRIRYDRLRKSRKSEILVPAANATCTACFTAIPRSRIGQLQSEGILIDGCEMCGAIIYLPDAVP